MWPRVYGSHVGSEEGRTCEGIHRSFHTCTQVAVGTVAYVRGLQWEQSRIYTSCIKLNRIYEDCHGHSHVCTRVAVR
jgi:hypothetical protein